MLAPGERVLSIIDSEEGKKLVLSPKKTNELIQRIYILEGFYRCKVCLNLYSNIVLISCGHLCACSSCAPFFNKKMPFMSGAY